MRKEQVLDLIGLAARLILGVVLIIAGAVKIPNPQLSSRAVQAYEILPYDLAGTVGIVLPYIEVFVGVLLVLGIFTRFAAIISTLLMIAFVIGISQAWARGLQIDCGCFGGGGALAAGEEPSYLVDLLRDAGLVLLGALLIWRPRSLASLDRRLFGNA